MELNAEFTQRAVVHAADMPWQPSPISGVERRMLDRVGDEVARATTIVRYAPGSQFSPHTHGGGEEFLVLEGVFQDEHGDYPVGTYVRNPPTSRHTPGSQPGCVILVKLWQFKRDDRTQLVVETAHQEFTPLPGLSDVTVLPLFQDDVEEVRLEKWAPATRIDRPVTHGLEIFVTAGSFHVGDELFCINSWLRLPPNSRLQAVAGAAGAQVWLKQGHLSHVTVPTLP
ncbi:cupin domain-containing protein [filamentous cyanobacterium LEGE 11480]|uniref:Cupin domain-containing protein n=2 Tax=Romeriopsis TaxID=2992131 RepID=A0A928VN06_9CYAN|nr:cupin domain-containing protein [Romeriopsis navalis LEGE 11480]